MLPYLPVRKRTKLQCELQGAIILFLVPGRRSRRLRHFTSEMQL